MPGQRERLACTQREQAMARLWRRGKGCPEMAVGRASGPEGVGTVAGAGVGLDLGIHHSSGYLGQIRVGLTFEIV